MVLKKLNNRLLPLIILCAQFQFLALIPAENLYADTPRGSFQLIKEGERSKIDGVVLNRLAYATLLSDHEYEIKTLKLEQKYELLRAEAEQVKVKEKMELELRLSKDTYEKILEVKESQIGFYKQKFVETNKKSYYELWFSGGLVVGILSATLIFSFASK